VIGIATQTLEPIPGQVPHAWVMGQRYVKVLVQGGATPWLIPLLPGDEDTLRAIYDQLDGVFLTGGVDVDPTNYGETKQPYCDRTDPARDWTELMLIRWALRDHKPLFGVCRGIQVINVACGGSLYQDVAEQRADAIRHDYFPHRGNFSRDYLAHPVRVELDTRLGHMLGAPQVQVNSMHHQGIKTLATGLRPNAYAPDGLIEGVEGANGHFLLAVQWHPEELAGSDAGMNRLFTEFVAASRDFGR
jgi:putative glutamine amidotransferase